ncbi:hypothetical protein BH09BAC5_BH09BAC5_01310 [soil metagenome]
MKKVILFFGLFFSIICKAQFCYTVSAIAYNPDPFNCCANPGPNQDDKFSAVKNLPFPFCFDGIFQTHYLISSNGYLSFDLALAGGFSDYQLNAPIPTNNPSTITNAIMAPWQDLYRPSGGEFWTKTYGVTPNRRFVLSFDSVAYYNCNWTRYCTSQIVLYESTNVIDIIIKKKQSCPSWQPGQAIEGIQNAAGTIAYFVPGRNYPTQWTATTDAYRFTPTCGTCSTLPIELLSFTGSLISNKTNRLEWSCASETNNEYFTLERSSDGINFQDVTRIQGAGNSTQPTNYSFDDATFPGTYNYYRLKQTDFNGRTETFGTVVIDDRNVVDKRKVVKVLNGLGQEINIDDPGFKIIFYDDGTVLKRMDFPDKN